MALIVIFTAIVLLFKFQNLDAVTVSLFTARATLPLSVLLFAVYVLGMLSGGFVMATVRDWVKGAARSG
jgi:uncharacterized integral membrane protein